jgi:hypothetical protein
MKRFLGGIVGTVFVLGLCSAVRADDKDATPIVDKAIKALGGEEKLSKVKATSWKAKGKMTFGGNETDMTIQVTTQGLDQLRQEFEGEAGGNKFQGLFILSGDKGWRKFGDMNTELDKNGIANQKRSAYLAIIPTTLVQLKGKGFKMEAAAEDKVGGKPAAVVKVTGPDGKDFTLFFDKDNGLPVKLVAKVAGFGGNEVTQETTFGNYKEFEGIKKATKIETKRDGEKFQEFEITDFKALDKVDAKTFDEPK